MLAIEIGSNKYHAKFADNSSVVAFKKLLEKNPATIEMEDYASMEKVGTLPTKLPQNNMHLNTVPGDIILYQGKYIVIYYDTNSYSLTPIAKMINIDQYGLKSVLGGGNIKAPFSLVDEI